MRLLYLDESGCLGSLPSGPTSIQPALCVVGLALDQANLAGLTQAWMDLKRAFYPQGLRAQAKRLDWQRFEVKGSELRKHFRETDPGRRRHATGFLDRSLDILESHECRFVSRVWLKIPGGVFNGNSVYTSSVQFICDVFHDWLRHSRDQGLVIADSRFPQPNSVVSHSIFTQKYRAGGDPLPLLVEPPVFGHSDNHTGLQLADLLASALLFPICTQFFADGRIQNSHLHARYGAMASRYVPRLMRLLLRPHDEQGNPRGGLVVSDPLGKRGAGSLFHLHGASSSAASTIPRLGETDPTRASATRAPARGPNP